jgi:uroporphyrinogen-III decarboxylase
MTSRERVLAALRLEKPDRVPYLEIGIDPALAEQLLGHGKPAAGAEFSIESQPRGIEEEKALARALNKDNIVYVLRAPIFAERIHGEDGRLFYGRGMIETREDLSRLHLPDPAQPELYRGLETFIEEKEDFALCLVTRAGFFPAVLSMGMERFFEAFYDDRPLVEEVIDRYTDWAVEVVKRVSELGVDVIITTDDLAWKQGPMISPELFREVALPRFRRVAEVIRKPWVMHTDGNFVPLIEDLLTLGPNGFHALEPEALDIREVKRKWGHRVALIGNVSLVTLGRGTPEEVEAEAAGLIRDLGPSGGYILSSSNSLTSYVPLENAKAMARAVTRQ